MTRIDPNPSMWDPFPQVTKSLTQLTEDRFVTECVCVPQDKGAPLQITLSDGSQRRDVACGRSALASGSQVFARMLDANWQEARDVACQQVPYLDAAEAVLNYLHGTPLALDESNFIDTSVMANYWDISALRAACHTFVERSITSENLCTLFDAACAVGDAAPGLSEHIWQCAGMLGLQSDAYPSDAAVQWLQRNPSPLPTQSKTVVQIRHLPDAAHTYALKMRWFEPGVLPCIGQGQSATWEIDGLQLHVKRIVQRKDNTPVRAAFDLRIDVPAHYPSQGAVYENGTPWAVHSFSFEYTLAPDASIPEVARKVASDDEFDDGFARYPRAWYSDDEDCPRYHGQVATHERDTVIDFRDALDASRAPSRPPPIGVSDDEADAFPSDMLQTHTEVPRRLTERTTQVTQQLAGDANASTHVSTRLWEVHLGQRNLSCHSGIFRADGNQFLQVDGTLRAIFL